MKSQPELKRYIKDKIIILIYPVFNIDKFISGKSNHNIIPNRYQCPSLILLTLLSNLVACSPLVDQLISSIVVAEIDVHSQEEIKKGNEDSYFVKSHKKITAQREFYKNELEAKLEKHQQNIVNKVFVTFRYNMPENAYIFDKNWLDYIIIGCDKQELFLISPNQTRTIALEQAPHKCYAKAFWYRKNNIKINTKIDKEKCVEVQPRIKFLETLIGDISFSQLKVDFC